MKNLNQTNGSLNEIAGKIWPGAQVEIIWLSGGQYRPGYWLRITSPRYILGEAYLGWKTGDFLDWQIPQDNSQLENLVKETTRKAIKICPLGYAVAPYSLSFAEFT